MEPTRHWGQASPSDNLFEPLAYMDLRFLVFSYAICLSCLSLLLTLAYKHLLCSGLIFVVVCLACNTLIAWMLSLEVFIRGVGLRCSGCCSPRVDIILWVYLGSFFTSYARTTELETRLNSFQRLNCALKMFWTIKKGASSRGNYYRRFLVKWLCQPTSGSILISE